MKLLLIHKLFFKPFINNQSLRCNKRKYTCKYHFNNVNWQNSFFYRSVIRWNELPNKLVSCKNLKRFQLKLKKFDLSKIFTSNFYNWLVLFFSLIIDLVCCIYFISSLFCKQHLSPKDHEYFKVLFFGWSIVNVLEALDFKIIVFFFG